MFLIVNAFSLFTYFFLALLDGAQGDLTTYIGKYPGYDGDIEIKATSSVDVKFDDSLDFEVHFDLSGVEAVCIECGLHIHEGKSCDDHDLVLGHYWNPESLDSDPWIPSMGAYYNTQEGNATKSMFKLNSGYDEEENLGHTVVVHAEDGTRIGCGVLETKSTTPNQAQPLSLRYSLLNIPIVMLIINFFE